MSDSVRVTVCFLGATPRSSSFARALPGGLPSPSLALYENARPSPPSRRPSSGHGYLGAVLATVLCLGLGTVPQADAKPAAPAKAVPKAPEKPGAEDTASEDSDGKCPAGTSLHRTKTERYCYHPNYNKEGRWEFWYESGQKKAETQMKAGKRHGKRAAWFETGQKKEECPYKDDSEEGRCSVWYKDGKKAEEIDYKAGKKHGVAAYWDEKGNKSEESHWKDGGRHGPTIWYFASGAKKEECEHKEGKREGVRTFYYESGKKKMEEKYVANRLEGLHMEWTPTAKFQSAVCFRDNNAKWRTDDEAKLKTKNCD